jgi:hypothetical protein
MLIKRWKHHLLFLSCVIGLALSMPKAYAQDSGAKEAGAKDQSKKAGGKKSTVVNFEDQLVEGEAQKPELFYLLQKKQFNYKRLIRLREDFLPEMRKTGEEIQRKGSAD